MRRGWPLLCALVVACNSLVGFDELRTNGGDDDDDDDAPDSAAPNTKDAGDAGAPAKAGRCTPTNAFAAPELIPDLDGADETSRAIMTPDELEIFYLKGANEVRHATRATPDAKWSAPVTEPLVPKANDLSSLAAGGLKLYYWEIVSDAPFEAFMRVSTRAKLGDSFGAGEKLRATSVSKDNWIFVTHDDDGAYWSEFRTGTGPAEQVIVRGNLVSNGTLEASDVANIHATGAQDSWPVVSKSELVLYFATSRAGGLGRDDVFRTSRASKAAPWGKPAPVTELSTAAVDTLSWISDDDCVALLSRPGHIFIAKRP